jgi:hypothetical protein
MSNAHVEAIVADAKTFDYTAAAPLDVSGLAVSDLHLLSRETGTIKLDATVQQILPRRRGQDNEPKYQN